MNVTAPSCQPFGEVLYAADLPPPISVNSLYHNVPKSPDGSQKNKGRARAKHYTKWIKAAGEHLVAQGRRPQLKGPVAINFTGTISR